MGKIKSIIEKMQISLANQKKYQDILRKKGVKIGEGCEIFKNAVFGTEPYLITIGNNVRITRNVQFITHDGALWVLRNAGKIDKNADKFGEIVIGDNCNIGWNAVIMPGVTIGENSIIGVGAIVTKDVPANSVAAGVPAKVIEDIDTYCAKVTPHTVITKRLSSEDKKKYLIENLKKKV